VTINDFAQPENRDRQATPISEGADFDAGGVHATTGTRLDIHGFDRDGAGEDGFDADGFYRRDDEAESGIFMSEHRDTGTALDLDGVDQEGVHHMIDSEGNCDSC
jgi:hypothetical protein